MPKMKFGRGGKRPFLGVYLGLWGACSPCSCSSVPLKANRALQLSFLTVLFALLAIGHLADNEGIVRVAAWVGLVLRPASCNLPGQ